MAWASCGELQGFPENTTDSQNKNKNIPELLSDGKNRIVRNIDF